MEKDYSKKIARKIGRRIRAARECRGVSREDLAANSGVELHDLQRYESGKGRISVDELESLAKALRLPVSQLLDTCLLCGNES